MADVFHSDLTDPYLHEPIGASTATSGDAYISNGAGSGAWGQVLRPDTTDNLEVGYSSDVYNNGSVGSGTLTLDEANSNFQKVENTGAFSLAPPASNGTIILKITNGTGAGAITFTGTATIGDSLTSTVGHKFMCSVTVIDGDSVLNVLALQ